MNNIPELFGINVFNDKAMKEKLPKDVYDELKKSIRSSEDLSIEVANAVAEAMKDWAVERGATHYTHWFQPMTGITAEKHDSFISPSEDGGIVMEFSGKELIKGEPDASSFPSGGLRATFEARGYTAWDPTSYAFLKDGVLCIPTAFCSFSGEVLDKKTPLLRSMDAVETQALRILGLFGNEKVSSVITTVGPEQEYFLIDKSVFEKRRDLVLCGRTLFGAKPPKGQELEDHYFGAIKPRVQAFMKELDTELWKLGIMAKTEHNEVAPGQHELAPIYTTANIACDHNQITMEYMKKIADKHGLACLLHERPFDGVNGSGKHNNWSLATDNGTNLFEPGKSPEENIQFLLFLVAVIRAVDEHADLLRISSATAGNDRRLGGNEAPPVIVSVFLGEELTGILESIEKGRAYDKKAREVLHIGASALPNLPKDSTDRNRTSPIAFTGNKFEFRMLGSSASVSGPNIVLNTAVADVLSDFADTLEKADNFNEAVMRIIGETFKNHKRIVYNGNNYCDEWREQARERGLLALMSAPEALPLFKSEKNKKLFAKHKVFTASELESRYALLTENYIKVITIEAQTLISIANRDILPAAAEYCAVLTKAALDKKAVDVSLKSSYEMDTAKKISALCDNLHTEVAQMKKCLSESADIKCTQERAEFFSSVVCPAMEKARLTIDELESVVAAKYWPFPIYSDILFSV